ncbi:MAG: PRC-barrel domain-containing protein [Chlorogloeopsis fritschii C42_A2020_084]|uniref:PRC-barrel domain-containing protein n=1 Tax=Chlorogloeopsis fritschii TaxID=1124 RepID=UPI0019F789D4|nr:PRC-barrel domain-containing protein [Chlorogloeopsis fritschii]MBF2009473.1 PRC-barrel domain-containing protein [Chlorogloeopsis fritschii C42_A2020_084]
MALLKLTDIVPNYHEIFGEDSIIDFSVYSNLTEEKIGTITDILVDEKEAKFRYLIIDLGFWIFGKKVLLPIGISWINFPEKRVYVKGLTEENAKNLPEFNDDLKIDYDYEDLVRNAYSMNPATYSYINPVVPIVPYSPMAINQVAILNEPMGDSEPRVSSEKEDKAVEARATYNYHHYPNLYEINDTEHPRLGLQEKWLAANKKLFR